MFAWLVSLLEMFTNRDDEKAMEVFLQGGARKLRSRSRPQLPSGSGQHWQRIPSPPRPFRGNRLLPAGACAGTRN